MKTLKALLDFYNSNKTKCHLDCTSDGNKEKEDDQNWGDYSAIVI